jgi:hypothetical protein
LFPFFGTGINNTRGPGGKFAASVVDTGGKFSAGVVDTSVLLIPVMHLYLRISPRIFEKI